MLKVVITLLSCVLCMPYLSEGGGMQTASPSENVTIGSENVYNFSSDITEIKLYMTFGEETKVLRFIWPDEGVEKCIDFQALKERKEFVEVQCKELLSKVWVDGAWRTITLNW